MRRAIGVTVTLLVAGAGFTSGHPAPRHLRNRPVAWQGLRWRTEARGGAAAVRSHAALRVSIPAAPTADPLLVYATTCRVAGAFTAQVDYRLDAWPSANGVRVGLLVNNPAYPRPSASDTTERTSFGPADLVGSGESYVQNANASGGGLIIQRTAAMSGTLRVRVAAGRLVSQYRDATTGGRLADIVGSGSGADAVAPAYPAPVSLALQVWSDLGLYTGPVRVTVSRFRLTRGACR